MRVERGGKILETGGKGSTLFPSVSHRFLLDKKSLMLSQSKQAKIISKTCSSNKTTLSSYTEKRMKQSIAQMLMDMATVQMRMSTLLHHAFMVILLSYFIRSLQFIGNIS